VNLQAVLKQKVILQGGGEHARVVVDCLIAQPNVDVIAIFDPKYSGMLFGVPQLGKYDPSFQKDARAIVSIGDNKIRKQVVALTEHEFTNAIHPSVIASPSAGFGDGNMFLHGVIIQSQAQVGNHVIINTGSRVDHDCTIGNYAHLAPGAILCGTVTIGEGAFVGAGAVVIPGKKIGAWAIVGAGSVVTRDIPDHAVAFGNPARIVKMLKP
jgi:sugar O-acyltransferase (sialic acid O-acetyltransferase NeuD family)